jgi:hypothetical protein
MALSKRQVAAQAAVLRARGWHSTAADVERGDVEFDPSALENLPDAPPGHSDGTAAGSQPGRR